jgi:hypothetical protein
MVQRGVIYSKQGSKAIEKANELIGFEWFGKEKKKKRNATTECM